jgi:hypothetical protein
MSRRHPAEAVAPTLSALDCHELGLIWLIWLIWA